MNNLCKVEEYSTRKAQVYNRENCVSNNRTIYGLKALKGSTTTTTANKKNGIIIGKRRDNLARVCINVFLFPSNLLRILL